MNKIIKILRICLLGILILFNISLVINLSLNNQYAIKEIRYIQNQTQAEGIQEIVEKDYKEIIIYLSLQIPIIILYFILTAVGRRVKSTP
jgi:hypothetical protein